MAIDFEGLTDYILSKWTLGQDSLHGYDHWLRVRRNGLILATRYAVNTDVIRLFSIFHDSRRINEDEDPEHGLRGAEFAAQCRGKFFDLGDWEFDQLYYACQWHTDQRFSEDLTIGICWDADRLDLPRVGIDPEVSFLNTGYAKELAEIPLLDDHLENLYEALED